MLRNLSLLALAAVSPLFAQSTRPTSPAQVQQPPAVTGTRPALPVPPVQPVAPDAPVVTIHGICPAGQASVGQKTESCTIVLTRAQFEGMIAALNVTHQTYTPAALRSLASTYVTLMSLADAGEKAGVEKDPRFEEYMRIARMRGLAETYRRSLEDKYANPSAAEIEDYYKQNISKFEQVKIERVIVPKVNPTRSQDKPAEFEKKARQIADQIRERAAKGEDMFSLQAEVYKSLGIQAMPPQTDFNPAQLRVLPGAVQQDVSNLKPGEVSRVEMELSGFNVYKLKARNTVPLEQARPEIVREISQKNVDAAMKAATGNIHSDFNEQFFSTRGATPQRVPGLGLRGVRQGNASTGYPNMNTTPTAASGGSSPQPSGPK